LAQPIGFDAPDGLPVSLLVFLLVPEAATQKHLDILSEIAELLGDTPLRERLQSCDTAQGAFAAISTWQSSHRASNG
jgi:PTS system nitrogen regulatory IIA component